MTEYTIAMMLGGALAGAAINYVRGGGLGSSFPASVPASLAFGALVALATGNPWLATVALGYWAGESFGWSKWINTVTCHLTQAEYNELWLADKNPKTDKGVDYWFAQQYFGRIEDLNYKPYVFFGMTVRGFMWWLPVFAILGWFDAIKPPAFFGALVFLSVVFPWTYWLAGRFGVNERFLKRAEVAYGAVYGAVFGAIL